MTGWRCSSGPPRRSWCPTPTTTPGPRSASTSTGRTSRPCCPDRAAGHQGGARQRGPRRRPQRRAGSGGRPAGVAGGWPTSDDEDVVVGSVLRFCTEVLATTYTPVPDAEPADGRGARDGPAGGGLRRCRIGPPAARVPVRDRHQRRRRAAAAAGWPAGPCRRGSTWIRSWSGRSWCDWPSSVATARTIEAALDRDPSAAGRVHAARARAALPGAEAKRTAWAALVEPSDLPASELYAIAEGVLPAGSDRADRGVRATLLRRDAGDRDLPQRLVARPGRADGFPTAHATAEMPRPGRADARR